VKGVCDLILPMPVSISDDHEVRCLIYDEKYQENFIVKETTHG
jgi:hypothetical protein